MSVLKEIEKRIFFSPTELRPLLHIWKIKNHHIVFTNGCFDLLHRGHLQYLSEARSMGDCLVVGLNSDASVSRLKGQNRPIKTQAERALMLAALKFVDAVVVFEEDTPLSLINTIEPDLLVKGGDYQIENIVGARELILKGKNVAVLPFSEGYSTSKTIEKIQQQS